MEIVSIVLTRKYAVAIGHIYGRVRVDIIVCGFIAKAFTSEMCQWYGSWVVVIVSGHGIYSRALGWTTQSKVLADVLTLIVLVTEYKKYISPPSDTDMCTACAFVYN